MEAIKENLTMESLLEQTTVAQVLPQNQKVITIPHTATLSEAIQTLSSNRILSAPVEIKGEKDVQKRYLGFLDMMDIIGFLLKTYSEDRGGENAKIHLHQWCQDIGKLEDRGRIFANHPVIDCVELSKKNPFFTVHVNSTLPKLIYVFHQGPHRAAVVNDNDDIVGIVSQSNIIHFLAKNIHLSMGPTLRTRLMDMNLGQKIKVFTIGIESKAIHAFHQMWTNKVSALAVVDNSGVIVANISISDLRGLNQENFASLLLPVLEFITKYLPQFKIPPLCVRESDTLETVLLKLAATKTHRVWVTDDNGKPNGVVSLTDVMLLLDLRLYVREEDRLEDQKQ